MSTTATRTTFTGLQLLTGNTEAWQAKRQLVAEATTSLDLAYFILEDDSTTGPLLQDLVAAAQRGVRVRLLLDFLMTYRQTRTLQALAAHPNLEVRQYGPPSRSLTNALQGAGIDVERFLAGLAGGDPGMVVAALPFSNLFTGERLAMLHAPAPSSPEAPLALALQVQVGIKELVADVLASGDALRGRLLQGRLTSLPALIKVFKLVDELNGFLHRMHHKLLLADGRRFIMGGRNLADAYQTPHPPTGRAFWDADLLAQDVRASCTEHVEAFRQLWDLGADVREAAAPALSAPAPGAPAATAPVAASAPAPAPLIAAAPVVDLPELQGYIVNGLSGPDESAITDTYIRCIEALVQRGQGGVVDIVSAYAFLDDDFTSPRLLALRQCLMVAAQAGITVHLRTNSLASTDLQPVNKCFYQKLGALMAAGVHIHELRDGFGSLHTKAAAIGEHCLIVGSYNMDPRSEMYDTNNLIVLEDPTGQATQRFREQYVHRDCWTLLTPAAAQALQQQTQKAAALMRLFESLL